MKFNISPKVYTVLGTYARAFIAAVVAAYTMGHTGVKELFAAGAASIIPVILRWANPADQFPAPQPSVVKAAAVVDGTQNPTA
jgi:hypothetical protein